MRLSFLGSRCFGLSLYFNSLHFLSPPPVTRTTTTSTPNQFHHFHSLKTPATEHPEAELLTLSYDLTRKSALGVLHTKAIKTGSSQNRLLNLYLKSGDSGGAQKLFDEMTDRDVRAWTILISGFSSIGSHKVALNLFMQMQMEGISPNEFTMSGVLKCCSCLKELKSGQGIHGWLLRNGIVLDAALNNSILDFYFKCGASHYVKNFFCGMREKDTISWNIMIGALLQNGDVENSLDLFRKLPSKDVSSWNTVISGLQDGFEQIALALLREMAPFGPTFNNRTFSVALALVSSLSLLELGREIHCRVLRLEINGDRFIRDSLINMYCKCGKMDEASAIFKNSTPYNMVKMKDFNSPPKISYSTMISGYVHIGRWEEALKTFCDIICERIPVDAFTLTSVISACASAGVLELGLQIHAYIQKMGHRFDNFLASSMIDMYTKCGTLENARLIFRSTGDRNVVLWTAIISGCALHGHGGEAISHFKTMLNRGIQPNEVSFVAILTACSHSGLIQEGCKYFTLMKEVYGIKPKVEHFTCMIDLFGRAGQFNEAKEFISKNGISHMGSVWIALLSSCRIHKNIEMGNWAAQKVLQLQPSKAPHILLSNMWAASHRWDEAGNIRALMKERGVVKDPGQSWVLAKNQICTFVVGDRSHPRAAQIYSYLGELTGRVKEMGYSSDVEQVMQDVDEEQKEEVLAVHSEKLALAYAIMSANTRIPIRVIKNLRICNDCHNFIKYTSQLLGREIVVRDIHRFHLFNNGSCSCGDYW